MKVFYSFLFLCFVCLSANGQNSDRTIESFYHQAGDKSVNLGVGFLNSSSFNFNILQTPATGNPSPSLNLSFDYGLTKEIGIGFFANYYRVEAQQDVAVQIADYADQFQDILDDPLCFSECVLGIPLGGNCDCEVNGKVIERVNVLTVGGKLAYHIYKFEKLDTYGSTYLGYSFNRRKTITESAIDGLFEETESTNEVPSIVYFASAGMRYYITPRWALYGEFGYGNVHLVQAGVTYRFY